MAETPNPTQSGNDILPIKIVEDPVPDITQDQDLQRSWHEFTTGMRMLQKHRQRINASADKIACANLKLLHHNLRSSAKYKAVLSHLKQELKNQSLFYHWPLSKKQSVGCSIIGIRKQNRHGTNLNQLLGDFVFRYFNLDTNSLAQGRATCMYLVMSGKLLVSRHTSEIRSTQRSKLQRTYSITSYKPGDVLMIPDGGIEKIVDIRANQKHTRLFGVYITESPQYS